MKRTKKAIYKMDVLYRPPTNIADKKEERLALMGQPDPVLTQNFKKQHAYNYQELMGYEADKAFYRAGCLPANVYEGDGTDAQKLEDYNDILVCRQQHQKRQKADDPSGQMNLFK